MNAAEIATIVSQLGIVPALLLFYVWVTNKRDAETRQTVVELERFQRGEMTGLITRSIESQSRMCESIEKLEQIAGFCSRRQQGDPR